MPHEAPTYGALRDRRQPRSSRRGRVSGSRHRIPRLLRPAAAAASLPSRRWLSHKPGAVRGVYDHSVMAQNFIACDREQELLLPPSLRDWLPEDHFAWFVLDAVAAMNLEAFFGAYRRDGWGRAAHDPVMMVGLLVYAYAIGERSSRRIERRCREDVAVRVITANLAPDHATIARFSPTA